MPYDDDESCMESHASASSEEQPVVHEPAKKRTVIRSIGNDCSSQSKEIKPETSDTPDVTSADAFLDKDKMNMDLGEVLEQSRGLNEPLKRSLSGGSLLARLEG